VTEVRSRFLVGPDEGGRRADAVVARHLGISAGAARRLVEAGAVRVDGHRAPKGSRLLPGATVEILEGAQRERFTAVVPDPSLRLPVLFEDAHLVVVDKPAGVASHPLREGELGTAANAIVAMWPECATASPDAREGGLAHRLDTPTSGVLMAARTRQVWTALRETLAAAGCEKRYLCLVRGAPPDEGHIAADIGRRGRHGRTVRVGGGRNPQAAETRWTVVRRGEGRTLLEARLHAGRAHQVRAHLAAAGFPIVGDDRYGEEASNETGASPAVGLRLHAAAIHLVHPVTGAALVVEAPPPPWALP